MIRETITTILMIPLIIIETVIKFIWGLIVILIYPLVKTHTELVDYGLKYKYEYRICRIVANWYDL